MDQAGLAAMPHRHAGLSQTRGERFALIAQFDHPTSDA